MPLLADDPTGMDAVEELLVGNYGPRVTTGLLDEIGRQLGQVDAELVTTAVRRHVVDTTPIGDRDALPVGHYPPSVAQLLVWVDRLQVERRRARRQQQLDTELAAQAAAPRVAVPAALRQGFGLPEEGTRYTAACRDCGDTGVARFWYDPRDQSRVWLATEFHQLDPAAQAGLSVAQAVCSCPRGMDRPEREGRIRLRRDGRLVDAPTYPRLEAIRRLAAHRRPVTVTEVP